VRWAGTDVGTLLQHRIGKSTGWLTVESRHADLSCPSPRCARGKLWARAARPSPKENGRCSCTGHCPSWARTRTLLIQRGQYNSQIPATCYPSREFVSPEAGVCWVLCSTLPYFTHTNDGVCSGQPTWNNQQQTHTLPSDSTASISTNPWKQCQSLLIRVSAVRASTTKGCSWGSALRQTSTTNWYNCIAFSRSPRLSAMRARSSIPRT
jgi:hypothetical protein